MRQHGYTIMVVEDETFIREMSAEILQDAGYEVLEAASAQEALQIIERTPAIALLFTDIRMPGPLDGMELAAAVHERWPNVRLLITSGHCWLDAAEMPDHGHFLPKPYRSSELIREIHSLLP